MAKLKEHDITFQRVKVKQSIGWNAPTYSWELSCSCGWKTRTNGLREDADRAAKLHKTEKAGR